MGSKIGFKMRECRYFLIAPFLLLTPFGYAQQPQQLSREKVAELLEKDGCVTLAEGKVKVCKYDYVADGNKVEAISFQPLDKEKSPGILLIPGYQGTAIGYLTLGRILAQQGFASLSVAQPGFGKSEGKADFCGPKTIHALTVGLKKFQREPYVDKSRMGIFGYSRGAMAASLMAVRLKEVKAAILGAGVYDFKKAYDEVTIEGIRKNMKDETGLTEKAFKERSSVLQMKKLRCPVLILHSAKDENVPVSQAYLLRDRLTVLKKDFEIKISPTGKHGFMDGDFVSNTIDFFSRRLRGTLRRGDTKKGRRGEGEMGSHEDNRNIAFQKTYACYGPTTFQPMISRCAADAHRAKMHLGVGVAGSGSQPVGIGLVGGRKLGVRGLKFQTEPGLTVRRLM